MASHRSTLAPFCKAGVVLIQGEGRDGFIFKSALHSTPVSAPLSCIVFCKPYYVTILQYKFTVGGVVNR